MNEDDGTDGRRPTNSQEQAGESHQQDHQQARQPVRPTYSTVAEGETQVTGSEDDELNVGEDTVDGGPVAMGPADPGPCAAEPAGGEAEAQPPPPVPHGDRRGRRPRLLREEASAAA